MRPTKSAEASAIDREHLTRLLLEQMEQTYDTEGRAGVTRAVAELLARLGDTALRDHAYALGLTSELELETVDDRRPEPPQTLA